MYVGFIENFKRYCEIVNVMFICGVDEVGRGPLAGEVFAAAVILPVGFSLPGLRDSKKMTEKARSRCYEVIIDQAVSWAVASASVAEIDSLNILVAAKLAMVRAVNKLSVKPCLVNVDGNQVIDVDYPCKAIVGGDDSNIEISAAAVIAKVTRDRVMIALDVKCPGYYFSANKGYGTKQHLQALKELGATQYHRRSFAPVKKVLL